MSDVAELRQGEETGPVRLAELEDEVRLGRVRPDATLRYRPWTGDRFVPLAELQQFAEAFDTPNARFAAHLRAGGLPLASVVFPALVLACGLIQLVLPLPVPVADALGEGLGAAMLGFEAVVLRGRWYTPWTSQLVHANLEHLVSNLLVLGYSGYRVGRALGSWGYAQVCAAALLGGALAIVLYGALPVVGASVIAYGLLGAQLAIGFRMGEVIPAEQRRYYGYGNLLLFAVLVSQSAFAEGVSHLGHLGGFVGGYAVGMLAHPPLMVPRAEWHRARQRAALVLAALTLGTALLGPALRLADGPGWGPGREVVVEDANVALTLPARLLGDARHPATSTLQGMRAWKPSPGSDSAIFVGMRRADEAPDALAPDWGGAGVTLVPVTAPPSRGPGWIVLAADRVVEGVPKSRVVEHRLLRGRTQWRLGMVVELDRHGRPGPEYAVFERALRGAQVGDPPALERARADNLRASTPSAQLALADALRDVGDSEQADGLYALVIAAPGAQQGTAVLRRLRLWAEDPLRFGDAGDPAWFEDWMLNYPADRELQESGLRWLFSRGRCDAARAHLDRLATEAPDAAWLAPWQARLVACGPPK